MVSMMIMHEVNIAGLDLNLVAALHALVAERHVTRAARRIGISQPAMSHALARLRERLGDPILVRGARGMQPTPRAEAMREPLERALGDIARVLSPPEAFDPARARRRFTIATNDYAELVLFPALLERLWREAPGVDVRVTTLQASGETELREGRAHLAIAPSPLYAGAAAPGVFVQRLFSDRFVCVVREGHPVVKKRLSLDAFCALPHALVSPRGEGGGVVDEALAKLGKKRRVAILLPHFLVAPHVVRATDVVLTLAERVARSLAAPLGLVRVPPPLEVPGFGMVMAWHEQNHGDAAHAWLRALVADVARGLDA